MDILNKQHGQIVGNALNLSTLKSEESYNKSSCAWFFSKKDQNWLLSNMAGEMPIFFPKGKKWNSSEQLYQASKYAPGTICIPQSATGKKDVEPDIRKRIEAQTNAKGSKMTQKCGIKSGLVRNDWDDPALEIRIHSMLWVLGLKLRANPFTFGKALLDTGDKAIVEKSSKDTFWGCKDIAGQLVGCNVLGKLLMITRERAPQIKQGKEFYPMGFLL